MNKINTTNINNNSSSINTPTNNSINTPTNNSININNNCRTANNFFLRLVRWWMKKYGFWAKPLKTSLDSQWMQEPIL